MGASCLIHLYAVVLQIREHLFEDLLISASANTASRESHMQSDDNRKPHETDYLSSTSDNDFTKTNGDGCDSRNSSVDLAATFENHMGLPFEYSTYQRGYVAKARRPPLNANFVRDLDSFAKRCWLRSLAMSDEVARLVHVHWLGPLEKRASSVSRRSNNNDGYQDGAMAPLSVFDEQLVPTPIDQDQSSVDPHQKQQLRNAQEVWTLGAAESTEQPMREDSQKTADKTLPVCDTLVAERFKLLSPQTPYHLFVAGKVQAARLKQAVTARARSQHGDSTNRVDVDQNLHTNVEDFSKSMEDEEEVVHDAIRRINDIWESQPADVKDITRKLDDIIVALEYCQLFWFSLDFAAHLKYLRVEASKPLLHNVFREEPEKR
ncbi:hypothetical protein H4R24_001306 [Coemansia sp. RSA 988]|nr:hypothetical protein H4R24_001306 [Coemansia sp. RSA 988]